MCWGNAQLADCVRYSKQDTLVILTTLRGTELHCERQETYIPQRQMRHVLDEPRAVKPR